MRSSKGLAFHEEAIKVSSKCLHEINRLRQVYRPDLPQYTVPRQCTTQTRKRKLAGSLLTTTTETPSAKRSKRSAVKRKAPPPVPSQTPKVEGTPPVPKRKRVSPPPPPQPPTPRVMASATRKVRVVPKVRHLPQGLCPVHENVQ